MIGPMFVLDFGTVKPKDYGAVEILRGGNKNGNCRRV